jgi:quercetin dioxygenase-like cupin family protein
MGIEAEAGTAVTTGVSSGTERCGAPRLPAPETTRGGGRGMKHVRIIAAACAAVGVMAASHAEAQQAPRPRGFHAFGPDQTIADIGDVEWAPLRLDGLPPGIEIAVLRGDLAKGGGEILLRTPPRYVVPNHSHTSDEVYVWLRGAFTYVAADGARLAMRAPAYISLPGGTPHALECGDEPCVFYLRYARPFDLHVHPMPPPPRR